MDWTWGWTALGTIATWVLVAGIGVAIWQIWETRRSTKLSTSAQLAIQLFQALREGRALDTLRRLYRLGPKYSANALENDEELKRKVENITDNLELLGALVAQGIFDKKTAIEAYSGSTALRCWYVLKAHMRKVRRERGGLYCIYLEDFAWRTWNHQRQSPQDEHILFYEDDPNKAFDLIQYFEDHPNEQPTEPK
jgi:hypothetical protein